MHSGNDNMKICNAINGVIVKLPEFNNRSENTAGPQSQPNGLLILIKSKNLFIRLLIF
jgi:hypothetical protein